VYCCCLLLLLLQRKLMERNVAEEIAGKVVDSVALSLQGQKLSSFTGGWGHRNSGPIASHAAAGCSALQCTYDWSSQTVLQNVFANCHCKLSLDVWALPHGLGFHWTVCRHLCCAAVSCCVLSHHAGVAQFVRNAFEDSISGILNKRQVDVLHDIRRKRAKGEACSSCGRVSGCGLWGQMSGA
jgi:hypothetical protein